MSENTESAAQPHENDTPKPIVEREDGQYASGDYGEVGAVGDLVGPEAGAYVEGDYGEGGTVRDEPALGAGGYVEGDYGEGGTLAGRTEPETGGYAEGDYGTGGAERPGDGGDEVADAEDDAPGPAGEDTKGAGSNA